MYCAMPNSCVNMNKNSNLESHVTYEYLTPRKWFENKIYSKTKINLNVSLKQLRCPLILCGSLNNLLK